MHIRIVSQQISVMYEIPFFLSIHVYIFSFSILWYILYSTRIPSNYDKLNFHQTKDCYQFENIHKLNGNVWHVYNEYVYDTVI